MFDVGKHKDCDLVELLEGAAGIGKRSGSNTGADLIEKYPGSVETIGC